MGSGYNPAFAEYADLDWRGCGRELTRLLNDAQEGAHIHDLLDRVFDLWNQRARLTQDGKVPSGQSEWWKARVLNREDRNVMPETRPARCEICRFWVQPHSDDAGQCHRSPPVFLAPSLLDGWPRVKATDWCGEFQRVVEDDAR
jgi:hypothetical protein